MSGLTALSPFGSKTGAFISNERDVNERVRQRAIEALSSPRGSLLLGRAITPYDAPSTVIPSAGTGFGVPSSAPGRWLGSANATSTYLQIGQALNYGGGYGPFIKGDDTESWYAAAVLEFVDAPDALSEVGLGMRNQSTGAFPFVMGVRGATSTTNLCLYANNGSALLGPAIALGTRYFCEAVRIGGNTRFSVNGVVQGSGNVYPTGAANQHLSHVPYVAQSSAVARNMYCDLFAGFVVRDIGVP